MVVDAPDSLQIFSFVRPFLEAGKEWVRRAEDSFSFVLILDSPDERKRRARLGGVRDICRITHAGNLREMVGERP